MNTNITKLCTYSLYRKKEFLPSKFYDKIKKRKNKSSSISNDRRQSPENKNKFSINSLYKKRLNNSIERLNISNIKMKNINTKKNIINKSYLYNKLNSSFSFYNLNYSDLNFSLNDIIYFSDESTLYKGKYFHNEVCIEERTLNYLSEKEQDKIQTEIMISVILHHKSIVYNNRISEK